MNPFTLTTREQTVELRLAGELTIADTGPLHVALAAVLTPAHVLAVDARELTRLDTAGVQLLLAAARYAREARRATTSDAWVAAFAVLGLTDPFTLSDSSQPPTP